MESERSPLLGAEGPGAPPPPYSSIQEEIEQFAEGSYVRCEVCSYNIDKGLKKNKKVITCPRCQEATALLPADKGKKFIRCPECNCLLIVSEKVAKAICPRDHCKVTIDLKSGKPLRSPGSPCRDPPGESVNATPQYRIVCGYCHGTFVQDLLPSNNKIRCPLCRRQSHIGDGPVRRKAALFIGGGLTCIIACLALMATTMGLRHNAGYWYIYLILLSVSILLLIKGLWCLCMKHSQLQLAQPIV